MDESLSIKPTACCQGLPDYRRDNSSSNYKIKVYILKNKHNFCAGLFV